LITGKLRDAGGDLAALPRAAAVVETATRRSSNSTGPPAAVADGLAELQVRWPTVPNVFGETRQLADEWTYRYLAARASTLPTTAEARAWARAAGITVPTRHPACLARGPLAHKVAKHPDSVRYYADPASHRLLVQPPPGAQDLLGTFRELGWGLAVVGAVAHLVSQHPVGLPPMAFGIEHGGEVDAGHLLVGGGQHRDAGGGAGPAEVPGP
jgi:hypothetical protein